MDFLEFAKQRYSVRSYSDRKVEKEKIDKILTAANIAPTAHNNQPQKIYVVQSEDAVDKIKSSTRYTFGASCFFIIGYDKNESWYEINNRKGPGAAVDPAIVCTHMMLEAHDLGLGTLWVGNFDEDILRKEFNIPQNIVLINILAAGYASDDAKPHAFHDTKKDLTQTVEYL
jgi:nitroreductase